MIPYILSKRQASRPLPLLPPLLEFVLHHCSIVEGLCAPEMAADSHIMTIADNSASET